MANEKRLKQLTEGSGMTADHLKELTDEYFGNKCVRWFYFDLNLEGGGDIPVPSVGKEIDIKVKHKDNPTQVTIELDEVDIPGDLSANIEFGRLTSELIGQIDALLGPYNPEGKWIKGIALTMGQTSLEDKFLLLELYIKEGESGEIKFIRIPPPPIIGDNLTPTSIPPGRRKR